MTFIDPSMSGTPDTDGNKFGNYVTVYRSETLSAANNLVISKLVVIGTRCD